MAQTHTVGLKVELQGAAQAQGAVRSVGQELDKIGPAAQSASAGADKLAAALGRISHYAVGGGLALIAGQVLGALTGSFAQVTGQFTDLQSRLQLTVGSASAATEAMGRLQTMARRTYSDFAGTTESFLGMSGALKELGYRTNEQLDFVESLNNALVVSGAKAERAAQVQDALGKAMALGTLQGDQLNTVISVGGRVAELLAEQLGVGVNQLRALGSQGKITGDIIYQALAGNLEKVRQEADAMPATIQDGMLLLGDAIKQTTADIDGMVGASAATSAALVGLADGVKSVGAALKDNQGVIKTVLGGALGAGAVGGIMSVARALSGAGGVAAAIGVVRTAFLALSAAMAANPVGLALLGIGAVTGAVIASNSKTVAERSTAWIEKEIAHQEQRIASAQRSLDLAGGSKGGKDPMTAQLEERLTAMKAYRQELQSEVWTRQAGPTGAGGGRGSINPPTVGEMRAQQQAATSAWQASIAGVKTATSVQQDYTDKLKASRAAFDQLAQTGLQGSALEQAQAQQLEYESALATERDKALKNLTAGTAQAGAAMAQANKLAVEDVQRSAAAMLGSYEDADAVLSAMRSAGLIGEQEYFQTKIGYLQDEAKIRIQALKDENTLLASQAQGKAKSLEAERQIAKNRAEIARIEQQALTKTTVLTVEAAAKRNQEAQAVEEQVAKLREEVQARELATADNISQAQALEQLRLARLAEALAQAKSSGASAEEIAAIEREIAARKELLQVMDGDAARLANAKAAEEAAKEWERTSKTIGDTLADYIMGGGKNAAQYLKRLFSTLVLQPMVQLVVGSVFGLGGAGAAAGQLGQLGQLGNLASGFNNLVNAFGKGAAGAASSVIGKAVPWLYDAGFKSVAQGLGAFQAGMASQQSIAAFTSSLKAGGAQMAGTIAGAVMNGFAGYGISKLISGGYEVNKYVNKIAGIASAIPGVGLIAGVIGGAINRLFGRKLKDTGIEGTFGGEAGFVGNTYEYYKGGLFRSNKTKRSPLDESIRKEFADYYAGMVFNTQSMGSVLGLDSSGLSNFSSGIKLSLKGLSAEEQQAKINEELERVQNELAQQVIGTMVTQASKTEASALYAQWTASGLANRLYSDRSIDNPTAHLDDVDRQLLEKVSGFLNISTSGGSVFLSGQIGSRLAQQAAAPDAYIPSEYALADEKAIDTLTRLATSLATVNSVLEELNHTLYAGSLAGADMAYKLSELFGGMEGFTAATSSFYENFFSEEEKRSKLQAKLSEAFSAVDLTLPDIDSSTAREQYRKLAEAQDLATESGRAAWAVILQLGEAFASITPTMEEAKKAAQEFVAAAVDDAFRALQSAVDAQRQIHNARISALQEQVGAAKQLFDLLARHIDDLRGNVASTAGMAAAQGQRTIDQAISAYRTTGYLPEAADIGSAAEAARSGLQSERYGNRLDFEADQLILANKLEALHGAAGKQLTADELLLAQEKAQLEQLELLFEAEKQALDIHRGTYKATLSVADAIHQLHTTIAAEIALRNAPPEAATQPDTPGSSGGHVAGPGSSSGGSSNSPLGDYNRRASLAILGDSDTLAQQRSIKDAAKSYEGSGDVAGLWSAVTAAGGNQHDLKQLYGWDVDDIDRALHNAGVPGFAQGINLVPQDMLARVHKDEAILPRAYNPFNPNAATPWGSSGQGDEASAAALHRIYDLLYSLGRQQLELLQSMERLARKADAIGTKQRTEEAAA